MALDFAFDPRSSRVTLYSAGVSPCSRGVVERLRVVRLDDRLHVDDVRVGDALVDAFDLAVVDVALIEFGTELREQRHVRWVDERGLHVEAGHRVEQRVHRAHPHVANAQHVQPVEAALVLPDRVEVGEHLGGVLTPAVAAVDDRHRRPLRGLRRCALLEVAHRDDVAVVLEHVDGVLDALLVEVAGPRHLRVGEPEDMPAEAVHRGLGRERVRVLGW